MEAAKKAAENYRQVIKQIETARKDSGRSDRVKLVGVTKTVSPDVINAVLDDGLSVIGENRVQEFLDKREQYHLQGESVHFIGALQRNKVKYIIDKVDMIESMDSLALAKEISKRAVLCGKVMPVLCEVNIDMQQSKAGFMPEDIEAAIGEIAQLPGISVKGLMCIPDPDRTPDSFVRMKKLFDQIKKADIPGVSMEELSMGMSGDYKEAIRYGATLVRVGRGIFGERKVVPQEISDHF